MRPQTRLVLLGGLTAALIGYFSVLVSAAAINLLAGRSAFFTAAAFGSAIFYGVEDAASVQIAAGPVLAYNMLHMVVFLALGMLASWLFWAAERFPSAQYLVLVTLILVAAHLYAAMLLFAEPLLGTSAWWELGLPSVIAAVAMGWYLLRIHPRLQRELREIPMGEVPGESPGPRGTT